MLFAIALGGALGTLARYLLGTALADVVPGFPAATLGINVVGSFALGLLMAGVASRPYLSPALRAALTVGFCGGFTTFSTFSAETVGLLERGAAGRAVLYAVASVTLSVAAAFAGLALARAPSPVR
jgi:CrcB protein